VQITLLRGKWTEESAHRSVATGLKLGVAHKGTAAAVVAQNDAMAIDARKAFTELANPPEPDQRLRLPFLGCDGLSKTGQAWVKSGQLTATVVTPPMAGQAVQLMANALRTNTTVAERTVTQVESYPPIEQLAKLQPVSAK
jgi:ribose transport system substrate-binding protein